MTYRAPVDDIMFALKTAVDLPQLIERGIYDGLDEETVRAVVEEAGRFGAEVLDPLNWPANPDLEWCPPGHGDICTAWLVTGACPNGAPADALWQRSCGRGPAAGSSSLTVILDGRA